MGDTPHNRTYKNLIEAHSWLGLSISVVLFLVFWAGSISLFRSEINQWASLPHAPIDKRATNITVNDIITDVLSRHEVDVKKPLSVFLPNEDRPYYWVIFDKVKTDPQQRTRTRLKINAKTGEVMPVNNAFRLADFIYLLHRDLNLDEFGEYLIGAVTLVFLFGLFSGVFIHAKRLVVNFFSYRIGQKRAQFFDLHTIVGVMSLPFTLMYAITGLMFNLAVVYQMVFVVFFYQGDEHAYKRDARPPSFKAEPLSGMTQDMTQVAPLIAKSETLGPVRMVRFYNYGDQAAVMQISGAQHGHFAQRYQRYIKVNDGSILAQSDYGNFNSLQKGRAVMRTLHFGDFATVNLRMVYFVLGIAVAVMIAAGNLLWAEKRQQARQASQKVTRFFSNLTLGWCGGLILATAIGFLLERTLPTSWSGRGDNLVIALLMIFTIVALSAWQFTNKRHFISSILYLTAAVLFMTVVCDWLLFADVLMFLARSGSASVLAVNIALMISSIVCFFTARRLAMGRGRTTVPTLTG